jgi:hypothetical protein
MISLGEGMNWLTSGGAAAGGAAAGGAAAGGAIVCAVVVADALADDAATPALPAVKPNGPNIHNGSTVSETAKDKCADVSVGIAGIVLEQTICDPLFPFSSDDATDPLVPPDHEESQPELRANSLNRRLPLSAASTKRKQGGETSRTPKKSRKSKVKAKDNELRSIADRKAMIVARKSK